MSASQVLVVEDEGIIALHLRQQLLKLGYDVPETVSTGDHALRKIKESRPDVILMDIKIAGPMDGIATAVHIASDYDIPIIYLTAYSESATLQRARVTTPYGYLIKPFSERELHAMIQMTLAKHEAERAAQSAQEVRWQAQKMEALGHLAGGVAHDFNALLAVVYRNLEEMGSYTVAHPKMAELVQDVFVAALEREKLAEKLLAFSRRQPVTPHAISVNDLVSTVAGEFRRRQGGQAQIETSLPEVLWKTLLEADQLETALSNLAANALDAMPDGGRLTFKGENVVLDEDRTSARTRAPSGRYVLLTIIDTGTGMPEHVIERAFEPFFTTKMPSGPSDKATLPSATLPSAGGAAGLGLSQVFGFVRQSGGHISINSDLGRGTTIRIYLPAVMDDASNVHAPGPGRSEASAPGVLPPKGGQDATGDPVDETAAAWHKLATYRKNIISQTHEVMWKKHDVYNFRRKLPATAQGEITLRVPWQKAEDALFAAVASSNSGVRYHLIVEELPRRNGWDWAVWRPGSARDTSRHGRASAVLIAMAAAEDAARSWDETERPPDGQ